MKGKVFKDWEVCYSCLMPNESIEGIALHANSTIRNCNVRYLKDKYVIVCWWYFHNNSNSIFHNFSADCPTTNDLFDQWLFSKNSKYAMYNYLVLVGLLFKYFYLKEI